MKVLAFDTETTGLPDFGAPSQGEQQPHLVEFSWIPYDTVTQERGPAVRHIIKPEGWTIPPEMTAIHGISHEQALAEGIREAEALDQFVYAVTRVDMRIAHNIAFDDRIIRIAYARYRSKDEADVYKARPSACTAKLSTPLVKAPPTEKMIAAGRHHFKTANLTEALLFFTGRTHTGAHGAHADAEACLDVWLAIQAGGKRFEILPEAAPAAAEAVTAA